MNNNEKIDYFNENLDRIFSSNENDSLKFISECLDDDEIRKALFDWPESIKLKIVDKYLLSDLNFYNAENNSSWSEYYEMYDGKFDDKHILQLIISSAYIKDIIDLGYIEKQSSLGLNNPGEGNYAINTDGDIIVIHSCPDLDIFGLDIKQFVEEIGIKPEWCSNMSISPL